MHVSGEAAVLPLPQTVDELQDGGRGLLGGSAVMDGTVVARVAVMGAADVVAAVVGAGAAVVGAAVVGATVVGDDVVGSDVVGATVVGAGGGGITVQ